MKFITHKTSDGYKIVISDENTNETIISFQISNNSLYCWQDKIEEFQAEAKLITRINNEIQHGRISFIQHVPGLNIERPENRQNILSFIRFILAWRRVYKGTSLTEILRLPDFKVASSRDSFKWLFLNFDEHELNNENINKYKNFVYENLDIIQEISHLIYFNEDEQKNEIFTKRDKLIFRIKKLVDLEGKQYTLPFLTLLSTNKFIHSAERYSYLSRLFKLAISKKMLWLTITYIMQELKGRPDLISYQDTYIHIIVTNYLKIYALDKAILVRMRYYPKRNVFLKSVVSIYNRPTIYFVILCMYLLVFSLNPVRFFIMGILWGLVPIISLVLIFFKLFHGEGFLWMEFALPRILGAVFIGLTILAFNKSIWQVSIWLPWGSWFALSVSAYLGSLSYIYLNVHKTISMIKIGNPESVKRSMGVAWRIFVIGIIESLMLTTLISSFLPLDSVFKESLPTTKFGQIMNLWNVYIYGNPYGIKIVWSDIIHMIIFPKIIILWAGLALLLGAFSQLLWQDTQITV